MDDYLEGLPLAFVSLNRPTDPIFILRSYAIDTYANLEGTLQRAFIFGLGAPESQAKIIFPRLVNSSSRNKIVFDLLMNTKAKEYKEYMKTCFNLINLIDEVRNQIVHWHLTIATPIHIVDGVSMPTEGEFCALTPLGKSIRAGCLRAKDLADFIRKADFVGRSLNIILHYIFVGPVDEIYLPLFAKAVSYPPHDGHPFQ